MTRSELLEGVIFTAAIWFMWALTMFTDTTFGRTTNMIRNLFDRGMIAAFFPLTAFSFTTAIIGILIEPTGFYETTPGTVLVAIFVLLFLVSCSVGLAIFFFDIPLPKWACPEYHAKRRKA